MNTDLTKLQDTSSASGWQFWRVPWLQGPLSALKPIYRETLLSSFILNLLALSVPVFVLQVYDRVVFHSGISTLQSLSIGMAIVLVFDFILRRARARLMQRAAATIDTNLRSSLFDRVFALPLRKLEMHSAVFWQSVFRDADTVRTTLSGPMAVLAFDLPFALLFLVMVMIVAWPVAWVLMLVLFVTLVLAWRSNHAVMSMTEAERQQQLARDTLVGELMAGRATIKGAHLNQQLRARWEDSEAKVAHSGLSRGDIADGYFAASQVVVMAATVLMTTVGAFAIMEQRMTIGTLIAANMLAGRLLGPFSQLIGLWRGVNAFKDAVSRMDIVFKNELERDQSTVQLARPEGRIGFDNVSFGYEPKGPNCLSNIKLEIVAKGLTAIVGPNGSGKSTFLKVLTGLYPPTGGRVLLDNADMAQFGRDDLARWIGYAPQESLLFSGTIRDNLTHGAPDASDEDIIEAASSAALHQQVIALPDGYGTLVGENGHLLSAGLRQRICLARALITKPVLVVLDEPTSHLDRDTETVLAKSLKELSKTSTVLVVTHSLAMLEQADNAIALENGRIRAAGPAASVISYLSEQGETSPGKAVSLPSKRRKRS